MTIAYLGVLLIIGATITYAVLKKKLQVCNSEKEKIEKHSKSLEEDKESINTNCEQMVREVETRTTELKQKYESLLSESKKRITELNDVNSQIISRYVDEVGKSQLAEIQKLKKELEELKDELEEAEDDNKFLLKKLKAEKKEKEELSFEFSKSKKELAEFQENLKNIQEELQSNQSNLNLKIDFLEFMQEILSARKSSDESVTELHKKVDRVIDYIRDELQDTIKGSSLAAKKNFFNEDLYHWANLQKKTWIQGKTSIAFIGEFSAGKTSIVNRILSQDDLSVPKLPVSTKATTAIPTYISGAISTRYEFVSPDNSLKNISEDTFKKISKQVLEQVKGVSSLITYFVMSYKNDNLNNLSILDTPGFSSNDMEDAERTIGVINECDALFWVFDVNNGTINKSSISLIKEHLKKPLYVVVNKVDTKSDSDVSAVEKLINNTLQAKGIEVCKYIRFSAKNKLSDIMNPIKNIKHDSSKETYLSNFFSELRHVEKESISKKQTLLDKYKSESEKGIQITNKYTSAMLNMAKSCGDVAKIPKSKPHLFRRNNYEMSQKDYVKMDDMLNDIVDNQIKQVESLFKQCVNAAHDIQNAHTNYKAQCFYSNRLTGCISHLKKLTNSLK